MHLARKVEEKNSLEILHINLLFEFTGKEKSYFPVVEMFYGSEYFC